MDKIMIAPCGMNCAICLGHLREKRKCLGCNIDSPNKRLSCQKCRIKNCEVIQNSEKKLCYECEKFPCARLKQLDERYSTNYSMSMTGNLEQIKNLGMDVFLKNQEAKYTCKECGGTICVHRGFCLECAEKE